MSDETPPEGAHKPLEWVNLADIVGKSDKWHEDRRVAAFAIGESSLWVAEECDDYFGTELEPGEIDALIEWLVQARRKIVKPETGPDKIRRAIQEDRGGHKAPPEPMWLSDWLEGPRGPKCEESPTGRCVYDHENDPAHDLCLVCGMPEERK